MNNKVSHSCISDRRLLVKTTLALTVALWASQVAAIQFKNTTAKTQTSFCESGLEEILKPVTLPTVVVTTVMNTREGKEVRRRATEEIDPQTFLNGTSIQLTNSPDSFFLVIGSDPMSGADNTWFWIVRNSGKHARVLLFAGANCIHVSRTKTLGYPNIIATWSSGSATETQTYKYDGKVYRLWRTQWKPNPVPPR